MKGLNLFLALVLVAGAGDVPASASPSSPVRVVPALAPLAAVTSPASASPGPDANTPAASPMAHVTRPQIGQPAPPFTLQTLDGKTVTLDSYKGKTLVINAWATWCPPCREEMPALISAAPRLAKGDVAMLGVDTTEAAPIVRAYAAARSVSYPLAVTTDDAFEKAYHIAYFPTTFIVDPQGILRARYVDVITQAELISFAQVAKAGRTIAIASALQQKLDATLTDASIVFGDDPKAVEANAKKAAAVIASAEDIIEASDAGADKAIDFLRTRSEEATLRDRAIAALVDIGTSVDDKTLLTRLRGDAAMDREDWHEAAGSYQAVLALAPNDRDALSGLALAGYRLGDAGVELDAYAKLVALDPTDAGSLVALARAQAKAGKADDANATFAKAVAAAQKRLAAAPHDPSDLRMLAYAHLYAGRTAAAAGDAAKARAEFDETSRLAAKLPSHDRRHDMYLEEAQEAIVALGIVAPKGLTVSLAPWTGPDLPGSIASTFKYRLAIAGVAARNVSLVASEVPKNWVASFCSDNTCAPFKTTLALPPSGVKLVEFQLVPPGAGSRMPKVTVRGSDGKNEASATT